ncbi:hypothetical protein [Streptomyces sp. NBRC 110611]|uniref:hypothetical protein n=1 Tax=Streptomyces sp. NBRC 110611 TaxID=1621259 RepID=UPI00082A484A|nr:hypothetical protein [Streptomyces sp. NBRC 110611]
MTHGYRDDARHTWLQSANSSAAVTGGGTVTEYGPRDLWAEVVAIYTEYVAHGRPAVTDMELNADHESQHQMWLRAPDNVISPAQKP